MRYPLPIRRVVALLAVCLGPVFASIAQTTAGYGDWQLHLPTNRTKALADAGNRIYVAAEDAFFYYDKELNTTRLLSQRDGLHDVGVSTVAYDSLTQQTLVAYNNANLDIFQPSGTIRNATDILRKQITGGKTINSIYVSNKIAYLSCSFGLVAYDMAKLEVQNTFSNIGAGGQPVAVYAATVAGGYLFAATSQGILRGRLTDNLLDYHSWTTTLPTQAGNPYQTLATQDGVVYAGVNGGAVMRFVATTQTWQAVAGTSASTYKQLMPSRAGLLIVGDATLSLLTSNGTLRTLSATALRDPRAALRSRADGSFYVADYQRGLVRLSADGQQVTSFVTNAPATSLGFSVLADASTNTVDVFSGGHQERYVQNDLYQGFYEYQNGTWTNITATTLPDPTQYPNPKDLTRGVRTPDGMLYVGSYGNGVLQWQGPGKFQLFNPQNGNSPLRSAISSPNYTRVTDLAVDADGGVWVVNRHQLANVSGLFVYNPAASTWQTLPYFSGSENLDRIALDDYGVAWVTTARAPGTGSGVVAFDATTRVTRYFTTALDGNGNAVSIATLYDVVKDRRGAIWVATASSDDGGVAMFSDPSQAFDTNLSFQMPILRRGDASDTGFPILRKQTVLAIAVDGANRKWFGTADNGLWLFDEDGTEALLHFTTDNSPLPSNHINDVAVNDRTGEVFVATDAGLVSYRGSATVTEGKPSCAKVSPNPVRANFTGQVGISGLANDAIIKITDVTGGLVYQTRANGGTLVWNLTDYNGRRVRSGVYLVLSSDADGKNGCISKIAVVGN